MRTSSIKRGSGIVFMAVLDDSRMKSFEPKKTGGVIKATVTSFGIWTSSLVLDGVYN